MKKLWVLLGFVFLISCAYAYYIPKDVPVQIQVEEYGSIVTGTFNFTINLSNTADCNNVDYTYSKNATTDWRGIVTFNMENLSINPDNNYTICYYRDGVRKMNQTIGSSIYAIYAQNVSWQGVIGKPLNLSQFYNDLNLSDYNSTYNATYATWSYNQTIPSINYTDLVISNNNASWSSTYNSTYSNLNSSQWLYSGTTLYTRNRANIVLNGNGTILPLGGLGLQIGGGFDNATGGKIAWGDGSGWKLNYVDTSDNVLFSFVDNGQLNLAVGGNVNKWLYNQTSAGSTLYVPYTGATQNVNLNRNNLSGVDNLYFNVTSGVNHGIYGYESGDANPHMGIIFNYTGIGDNNLIQIVNSQRTNWETNSTPLVTFTRGGKVGIGNNNPNEALDILGNIALKGKLIINDTSDQTITLLYDGYNSTYLRNYQGWFYIYHRTPSTSPTTRWDTNGNMILDGNLTVGSTEITINSQPVAKWLYNQSTATYNMYNSAWSSTYNESYNNKNTSQFVTNGTAIYNINTGNVGIGTINPSQKLDVVGKIQSSDSLYLPDLWLISGTQSKIQSYSSKSLVINPEGNTIILGKSDSEVNVSGTLNVGLNNVNKWLYNQSVYPITYLNTTYGLFWYNQTIGYVTSTTANSTYVRFQGSTANVNLTGYNITTSGIRLVGNSTIQRSDSVSTKMWIDDTGNLNIQGGTG